MPDLFSMFVQTEFTTETYLITTLIAVLCGVIAAICAGINERLSKSFIASLILLPAIIETVIIMVNGNIGTGVAVMGAFSLVRFRSVPGRAKDIVAIFIAMTSGLACAAGYSLVALVFTVIVCLVMVLISFVPTKSDKMMELQITVPETINYSDMFKADFDKYLKWNKLKRIKTTNMGSLFKLTYLVEFKNTQDIKEFIDAIRIKNGNLEISVCQADFRGDEL